MVTCSGRLERGRSHAPRTTRPVRCVCLFPSHQGITLASSQAVSNAKKMGWPLREVTTGVFEAEAPGGYKFYLEDKERLKQGETRP